MAKQKERRVEEVAQEVIVPSNGGAAAIDATKAKLVGKRKLFNLPQWAVAWLVLLPALFFIIWFMLFPIVNTTLFAFIGEFYYDKGGSFALSQFITATTKNSQTSFFGFDNFVEVMQNQVFLHSIRNTAELVVIEVPLTIIVSLLLATFLNSIKVLKGFYQTIFFLPYVTNTIALGLVFNIAFSRGSGGLVNIFLHMFGVDPINWLSDALVAGVGKATRFHQAVVIVAYSLWNGLAFKILVFMSGLATIDKQYYDAAKIDGSSSFTIWRRITLPLLSPQILYITITSFIGAFKMYTGVMAVYQGTSSSTGYYFGPTTNPTLMDGDEWIPVVGWIYRYLSLYPTEPGIPSAGSLVLLGIILMITIVQFAVSKKRVHY